MGMNKEYDFFAATVYQPEMTPGDLVSLGITAKNSELLDKEVYKNNDGIKERFTVDGKFDEAAFDNAYNACASAYNAIAETDFKKAFVDNMAHTPEDWMTKSTNVADVSARASFGKNATLTSTGIEGIGKVTASPFSDREIGQRNNVRDSETGKVLDYTPNDIGFLRTALGKDTYVLAQYDEDTVDEDGIRHRKGELKRDEDGATYYETLGNRSASGRIVLNPFDVLTEDGSAWNSIDFMDSDGIYKNPLGSVAKAAVKIIPAALCPEYAAATAILNFAKVTPELCKAIGSVLGAGEAVNAPDSFFSRAEGFMARFNDSVSDYSQQKQITWENGLNFVADTAIQLFQQRNIAKYSGELVKALGSSNPDLAKNLSYAYLVSTSCEGVYNDFREAGASDWVAGAATLGNMWALGKLLDNEYYKDVVFHGLEGVDPSMVGYKRQSLGLAKKGARDCRRSTRWHFSRRCCYKEHLQEDRQLVHQSLVSRASQCC